MVHIDHELLYAPANATVGIWPKQPSIVITFRDATNKKLTVGLVSASVSGEAIPNSVVKDSARKDELSSFLFDQMGKGQSLNSLFKEQRFGARAFVRAVLSYPELAYKTQKQIWWPNAQTKIEL